MIVQPVIKLKTKSNNFKRYRGPPHRTMLKVILRIGLVELNSHVRVVLKKEEEYNFNCVNFVKVGYSQRVFSI